MICRHQSIQSFDIGLSSTICLFTPPPQFDLPLGGSSRLRPGRRNTDANDPPFLFDFCTHYKSILRRLGALHICPRRTDTVVITLVEMLYSLTKNLFDFRAICHERSLLEIINCYPIIRTGDAYSLSIKPGSIPGASHSQQCRNWYLLSFGGGEGKAATERR